jgi:hypothetical protein
LLDGPLLPRRLSMAIRRALIRYYRYYLFTIRLLLEHYLKLQRTKIAPPWTQGRYDIVIVIEAPDELSATALNLSLSTLGNIRTESLRAFSSTDMLKIVAKML